MRALLAVLFVALSVSFVLGTVENISLFGCTPSVTACNGVVGEVADVNYDASQSPSTSWKTIGDLTSNGFAVVNNLLPNTVYEFRLCKGGNPSVATTMAIYPATPAVPLPSLNAIGGGGTCGSCNGNRPWVTFNSAAGTNIAIVNCVVTSGEAAHTLEFRIQPCAVCAVNPNPYTFQSGATGGSNTPFTLSSTDINNLLVSGLTQSCTAGTVSPSAFYCAQFEKVQNVTVTKSASNGASSKCPRQILIQDNVDPTLVCPVSTGNKPAIPVKTCLTSFTGNPATNTLAVTMCTPAASDFPFADFNDNCKGDPRFGLVTPSSVNSIAMNLQVVTSGYSVSYSQTIMNGNTFNYSPQCSLTMSVLTIVYPNFQTPVNNILLGFTYYVAWASSIQYLDLDQTTVKYETEFRIYLQEAVPSPGQSPQIINLQDLVYKTLKTNKPSIATFNINPATPLKSNKYYLIVQGRNSGVNSVTNPILTITN